MDCRGRLYGEACGRAILLHLCCGKKPLRAAHAVVAMFAMTRRASLRSSPSGSTGDPFIDAAAFPPAAVPYQPVILSAAMRLGKSSFANFPLIAAAPPASPTFLDLPAFDVAERRLPGRVGRGRGLPGLPRPIAGRHSRRTFPALWRCRGRRRPTSITPDTARPAVVLQGRGERRRRLRHPGCRSQRPLADPFSRRPAISRPRAIAGGRRRSSMAGATSGCRPARRHSGIGGRMAIPPSSPWRDRLERRGRLSRAGPTSRYRPKASRELGALRPPAELAARSGWQSRSPRTRQNRPARRLGALPNRY